MNFNIKIKDITMNQSACLPYDIQQKDKGEVLFV